MDDSLSFGIWLRRRRRALDLTQPELAARVACAVITLQKIEAEERRPSRAMAERLADTLAVPPHERAAFIAAARRSSVVPDLEPPEARARPLASTPLPGALPAPLGALIGREREVADVLSLLRSSGTRLLTFTGLGGVGKTRLALEAASQLADQFLDGVCFVPLGLVKDPALVAGAIARTLNVREQAEQPIETSLQAFLRPWHGLLLLDNFEQIAPAAPLLAGLLAAAPRLTVLVTSRVPLRLTGEYTYAVQPLALPDPAESSPERIRAAPAVQLFSERARARRADVTFTDATAAVAEICRRLEGLPLAIEMAAARVTMYSPAALLARLDQRLRLLTNGAVDLPARQQTLRATIDWSYSLLDPAAQALFAHLAVFVGGCTLEAAEAVCDPDGTLPHDVFEGVAALLDQSLLYRADAIASEPRVMMLETIREYALEQLSARGELVALRRRHAAYFLALAETAESASRSTAWHSWQVRLEVEYANLRAALSWATEPGGDPALGLRLVRALMPLWNRSERQLEGRRLTLAALATGDGAEVGELPAMLRGRALYTAGVLTSPLTNAHTSRQLLEQSMPLLRAAGDRQGLAEAQVAFGRTVSLATITAREALPIAEARRLLEEGIAVLRSVGDDWSVAEALFELALLADAADRRAEARAATAEGLELCRAFGNNPGIARGLWSLSGTAQMCGDLRQATSLSLELVTHARAFGLQAWEMHGLAGCGWVAWLRGAVPEVSQYFRSCKPLAERLGEPLKVLMSHQLLSWVAWAEGDLTQAEAGYREGLTMAQTFETTGSVAWSLNGLGLVALSRGDPGGAECCFAESLALFRKGYIPFDIGYGLSCLGRAALAGGDTALAGEQFAESVAVARSTNNRWVIAQALEGLAATAVAEKQWETAARHLGAAARLRERMGVVLWPPFCVEHDRCVAGARAGLGAGEFEIAWQAGQVMDKKGRLNTVPT